MDGIWIALITGCVTLITSITSSILVFKSETKKTQANQEAKQQAQIDELRNMLLDHKSEYMNEINEIKDSITEMQSSTQKWQAIFELKLEYMTKEFNDMKIEVREHNNFAKKLPVLEEKIINLEGK